MILPNAPKILEEAVNTMALSIPILDAMLFIRSFIKYTIVNISAVPHSLFPCSKAWIA
jgi:hypothetical protein